MLGNIVAWLALTLISVAFAPKPKSPKPAKLSELEVPTADKGRPMPVLFGTRDIKAPNNLWYGHLRTKKVKD